MSNLYMRKTAFLVSGHEITTPRTIKFSVPFGENEKVDTIDIRAYNLKGATINAIATNQAAIRQRKRSGKGQIKLQLLNVLIPVLVIQRQLLKEYMGEIHMHYV